MPGMLSKAGIWTRVVRGSRLLRRAARQGRAAGGPFLWLSWVRLGDSVASAAKQAQWAQQWTWGR